MSTDEFEEFVSEGMVYEGDYLHLPLGGGQALVAKLRTLEAQLAIAEELVEHILTSESMNPELRLAEEFRAAGEGDKG